jgi:hypothetical protein
MFRTLISSAATACAVLVGACLLAPMMANAQSLNLNFTGCNGGYSLTGTPPNQSLNCLTGSGPPTGCSISGPTSASINSTITLTAVCSGGGAATGWSWSGGNCGGLTTQSCQATQSVANPALTYTVVSSNASGGPSASKTVNWTAGGGGPPPPPPPPGGISCSGFANTVEVALNWTSGAAGTATISENDAVVVSFTAGTTTHLSQITAFEFGTPATGRLAVLSTTPCDFAYQPPALGIYAVQGGSTVTQRFAVAPLTGSQRPQLQVGTKYYWNIATNPGLCGGNCQIRAVLTP